MKDYTGAVLLNSKNAIYLVKEDDVNAIGQDRWNLPGGSVDQSESLINSVKREVKEETGYNAEVKSLVGCYKAFKGDKDWLYIVFELLATNDQTTPVDMDIKEGKWFEKTEFLALDPSQMVHSDMKLVYQIAIENRGLPLESVKFINYNEHTPKNLS